MPQARNHASLAALLEFGSIEDYNESLGQVARWRPAVVEALRRHGLESDASVIRAGIGGTHATFVCRTVVIKFFGCLGHWRRSHGAERDAFGVLARIDGLAAPALLCEGTLLDRGDDPWPYLISERVGGEPWDAEILPRRAQRAIARDLGRHLALVHDSPPDGVARETTWNDVGLAEAARRSCLPGRLTDQVADYVHGISPRERVPVHGDIIDRHVRVDRGRLAGVIDWGDMIATDRHYELAKTHLNLFQCDKDLLADFLSGGGWTVGPDFERRALVHAFHRQAHCIAQHMSCDVFFRVGERVDLDGIRTLDELAAALFRL